MKYRMAPCLAVLALVACSGQRSRAPAKEPVGTTSVTSSALTVSTPATPATSTTSTTSTTSATPAPSPEAPAASATEADRRLAAKVRQHLARKPELADIPWNRIQIISSNGHVRLVGYLPTIAEVSELEQAVREVRGVTAVTNEIRLPGDLD